MTLNGIDIANYQRTLVPKKMTTTNFIIVKATESNWYVNECFADHAAQVVSTGKKLGCYHFARPGNAVEQADFFLGVVKKYFNKAVFALDWEENAVALGPGWAKKWLDRVYKKTGVKPVIYMSKSVCNAYDWSAVVEAGYELWVAQYPDYEPTGYQKKPWTDDSPFGAWDKRGWTIFQYASTGQIKGYDGDLDLDLFDGSADDWTELASGSLVKSAVAKVTTPKPAVIEDKPSKMVLHAIDIANDDSHGYSQYRRWPDEGTDFDCSSLMYECAYFAGYDLSREDPRYTGSMLEDFTAAGFTATPFDGNLSDLEPGDILLNVVHHTEMYIGDGKFAGAHIAETGDIDGEPGDQTGNEISICDAYIYWDGWDYVLEPPRDKTTTAPTTTSTSTSIKKKSVTTIAKEVLAGKWSTGAKRKKKLEKAGYDYAKVQAKVNQLLGVTAKTVDQLANEVIQGKWGNGQDRINRLKDAGYDPVAVQDKVNEILL